MENQYQKEWGENTLVKLYDKFRKFIDPAEQEYIKILISEIEKHFKTHKIKKIKLLDIGAGAGHSTIPILEALSKNFIIEYDYLDISSEQKKEFKKEARKNGLEKTLKNFWITPWESFSGKGKYDLILSYHSWYGITSWGNKKKNTIIKIKKYLTKNGMGVIVINSRNNIAQKTILKRNGEITGSGDLVKTMKKLKIFFLNKSLSYNKFSKTTFLKNKKITKDAYNFFGYLYRKPFNKIDQIEKKSLVKNLSNQKDNAYFKIPCEIITIFK